MTLLGYLERPGYAGYEVMNKMTFYFFQPVTKPVTLVLVKELNHALNVVMDIVDRTMNVKVGIVMTRIIIIIITSIIIIIVIITNIIIIIITNIIIIIIMS